jgi:hypothetical protein
MTLTTTNDSFTSRSVHTAHLNNQHAQMIQTFGELINGDDASRATWGYWSDVALKTQAVCDALMASGAADGKYVAVTSPK